MNKLKLGLIGIVLPLLAGSGCREFTIGGVQLTDRSKSPNKQIFLEKANSMEVNIRNAVYLVDFYGSMKEWTYMNAVIREITNKDFEKALVCDDIAMRYYEFFGVKPPKVIKRTEK